MKFRQIFASLITISLLNSTFCTNFILKSTQNDKKLSSYVCKVTKDIIKSSVDTQDVLIGNLGGKSWTSTINDIARCVRHDSAVVISDFKVAVTEKTLKKASIIILTSNRADQSSLIFLLNNHQQSTVWHHMAKIIIILPKEVKINDRFSHLRYFISYGFLNVVVVHETQTHDIRFETYLAVNGEPSMELNDFETNLIFPDKLKNMVGYKYFIVVYKQIPRVIVHQKVPKTPLMNFVTTILKIQNATVEYIVPDDERMLVAYYNSRNMDFTLNTGISVRDTNPKLMTYEENAYCALVPLPPTVTFSQMIFIEPFDFLTWMFLLLSIVCSLFVWWMFRGRDAIDSPWLLAYGMFVMFVGQGVDFSRKNRLVLTILLELIIVMIWILNNAYDGVVTSFMIQPIHRNYFETFDEIVESDYEIISDEVFTVTIRSIDSYKSLLPRLNSSGNQLRDEIITELQRQHFILIMPCDVAEVVIDVTFTNDKKASDFYYMLPQKIFPSLVRLEASYLNPFIERLQYYMDLCFQAGLMHFWKIMSTENKIYEKSRKMPHEEEVYLELKDIWNVFGVLFVGCLSSSIIFLLEIFFHFILSGFVVKHQAKKLKDKIHQMAYKKRKRPKHPKYQKGALYYIIHRRKKVKRLKSKKLKVRKIYVQPRFPMD